MEEYHSDYPSVPTEDPNNPYYECAHCGRTDPQINGEIKNHAEWCEYRIKKETGDTDMLNRKILARNIRHRLADMLGSQWTGALDAAMDEMLLDEIDKHLDTEGPVLTSDVDVPWSVDGKSKEEAEGPVHVEPNDSTTAWPLRKRDDEKPMTPFVTKTGKDIDPETWARHELAARHARAARLDSERNENEDGDPYLKGIMDKD